MRQILQAHVSLLCRYGPTPPPYKKLSACYAMDGPITTDQSRTGQKILLYGRGNWPICRANETWACEISLVPRLNFYSCVLKTFCGLNINITFMNLWKPDSFIVFFYYILLPNKLNLKARFFERFYVSMAWEGTKLCTQRRTQASSKSNAKPQVFIAHYKTQMSLKTSSCPKCLHCVKCFSWTLNQVKPLSHSKSWGLLHPMQS